MIFLGLFTFAIYKSICDFQTVSANTPFQGRWKQQVSIKNKKNTATFYKIYQDSILFSIANRNQKPINQVIRRDTFLANENRFIGHTYTNQYYLIFLKYDSNQSIKLFKQEVANVEEGLRFDLPQDYESEVSSEWDVYHLN